MKWIVGLCLCTVHVMGLIGDGLGLGYSGVVDLGSWWSLVVERMLGGLKWWLWGFGVVVLGVRCGGLWWASWWTGWLGGVGSAWVLGSI